MHINILGILVACVLPCRNRTFLAETNLHKAKHMESKRQPLTLATYWIAVGTDNMQKVIDSVGSSLAYFRIIKGGRKGISPIRAEKIIEAARLHTPGFEPDFELMVRPRRHTPSPTKGRKIGPSPEFLEAQRRAAKQQPEILKCYAEPATAPRG